MCSDIDQQQIPSYIFEGPFYATSTMTRSQQFLVGVDWIERVTQVRVTPVVHVSCTIP